MSEIRNINIEQIYPHPENPRKDIGDITELAESIKKNGIMQNLTVIPGHFMNQVEWDELCQEYKKNPTEETRLKMNTRWLGDGYTLIIGHRRCAASRAAGLTELPCRIIEGMSRKEQIATMLEENMQRNDLTIYEQAQGFQLMLDLGETVETIAQKTGFSRSTIHHRLNIAKLDGNELQKKENGEFQLTLKDLYELEKVKDIKKRNEILKNARDSRDLIWRAQSAAKEERQNAAAEKIIKMLKELEIPKAPKHVEQEHWSNAWIRKKEFDLDKPAPEEIKVRSKKSETIYWLRYYGKIIILKRNEEYAKKKEEENEAEKIKKRNKKQIMSVMRELEKKRKDFILNVISGKIAPLKDELQLKEQLWSMFLEDGTGLYISILEEFFNEKESWRLTAEEKEEVKKKIESLTTIQQMLVLVHRSIEAKKDIVGYYGEYRTEKGEWILRFYKVLERYGWYFTDEELSILDGSSELYIEKE